MINHQKVLITKEEVRKFVVETHEFSQRENQYKVGLNNRIYRGASLSELIDQIEKISIKK